ncbi:hypothetical protein D3C81_2054940 [compost metagenome]
MQLPLRELTLRYFQRPSELGQTRRNQARKRSLLLQMSIPSLISTPYDRRAAGRYRFWVTKDSIWSAVEITLEFIS